LGSTVAIQAAPEKKLPKSPTINRDGTPAPPGPQRSSFPAPSGLTAQAISQSQILLRWDPVAGATGYEVLIWKDGRWWFNEDDPNMTPIATGTTLVGLLPNTAYELTVRAIGPSGISSVSTASVGARTLQEGSTIAPAPVSNDSSLASTARPAVPPARTPTGTRANQPPTESLAPTRGQQASVRKSLPAPEAPGSLLGLYSDKDQIKLQWRKVPDAIRYSVEEELDGKWVLAEKTKGDSSSTSLLMLDRPQPGPYRFRVRAVNREGTPSEPSWPTSVEH
jgi:hypothetical protein